MFPSKGFSVGVCGRERREAKSKCHLRDLTGLDKPDQLSHEKGTFLRVFEISRVRPESAS